MKEVGLRQVYDVISESLEAEDQARMNSALWPALNQFPGDSVLHHFASHAYTKEDRLVSALLHAQKSNELEPSAGNYINIGSILRRMNMPDAAYVALNEAIGYEPKNPHAWNNLAASYVNEGNPEPGLVAAREAVRLDPDFKKAIWNKGLLELEVGNFADGFASYRSGLSINEIRMMKNYTHPDKPTDDEPKYIEDFEELIKWRKEHQGSKPRIIVWGEQGMGDEIMFSTCLPDLVEHADIIFDCHPRMEKIMLDSYGDICTEIYPTRKLLDTNWYKDTQPCQFKCSIGELPNWFRRDLESFHKARNEQAPWLVADPELVKSYRDAYEELMPGKKYVGFGWTGGIISTQRWYRSAQLPELSPMLLHPDIQPISLQYEDDTMPVQHYLEKTGKLVYRFPGAKEHYDYHHTLAMVAALDCVVTVCQTVAHLSAAAGQQTMVLVPNAPAWRYGLEGTDWFWYPENATLHRRPGDSWAPAIQACTEHLFRYLELEEVA